MRLLNLKGCGCEAWAIGQSEIKPLLDSLDEELKAKGLYNLQKVALLIGVYDDAEEKYAAIVKQNEEHPDKENVARYLMKSLWTINYIYEKCHLTYEQEKVIEAANALRTTLFADE